MVKKNNCHLFLLSSLGFRTQRVSTGPYYAHAVRLSACHWGYILADVKGSQLKFSQIMYCCGMLMLMPI